MVLEGVAVEMIGAVAMAAAVAAAVHGRLAGVREIEAVEVDINCTRHH
jgi:hypothetical protein